MGKYDKMNKEMISPEANEKRSKKFQELVKNLYVDKSHFIYELLQNAEDQFEKKYGTIGSNINEKHTVKFALYKDRLEFQHNGQLFNDDDVKNIIEYLSESKKHTPNAIGKFGIGFKSVYTITEYPRIHSGNHNFKIKSLQAEEIEPLVNLKKDQTKFIFPLKDASDCFKTISDGLRGINKNELIFLKWISQLEITINDDDSYANTIQKDFVISKDYTTVVLTETQDLHKEIKWIVFEKKITDENVERLVKIAYKIKKSDDDNKSREQIERLLHSPIFSYFSTKIDSKIGFLIHAPFHTTPSRDALKDNDSWNATCFSELVNLLCASLDQLRDSGLLTASAIRALPIHSEHFDDSYQYKIFTDAVLNSFKTKKLIPTVEPGVFVESKKARMTTSGQMKEVFKKELLSFIFGNPDFRWVTNDITENKNREVWEYLKQHVNVEVFRPEQIVSRLTIDFYKIQKIPWFVEFYKIVSDIKETHETLQKSGCIPTTKCEIVRLTTYEGHPNVYLPDDNSNDWIDVHFVHQDLLNEIPIKKFLTDCMQIKPYNYSDYVIDKILPNYNTTVENYDKSQYEGDYRKILHGYEATKNDLTNHKRYVEALRKSHIFETKNSRYPAPNLRCADMTFIYTDELEDFYSENYEF